MADGYSSDESFDEFTSKQARSQRKEPKSSISYSQPNTTSPGKNAKDKSTSSSNSFTIPEILCQCLQRCTERVTPPLIQKVCMYFKGIPERSMQYKYLASLILIRMKQVSAEGNAAAKGKSIRKMSFKYYVPVLSEADMKNQIEKKKISDTKKKADAEKQKALRAEEKSPPDRADDDCSEAASSADDTDDVDDWDHIEVCLGAFTAIHVISEKRVTITRATRKLKTEMKCSKPFLAHSLLGPKAGDLIPIKKKPRLEELSLLAGERQRALKKQSAADVSRLASEWLAKQAAETQRPSYAINPKTLLPEGLVLPASVTCLPIFPKEPARQPVYRAQDHERNVDIVNNFFSDQLWKPEYTG